MKLDTVRKALESLPDGYRIIFSLYMIEGYDHGEIAKCWAYPGQHPKHNI